MANQISTDLCVTPNAKITGKISGRVRQLDVLIDSRHDTDNSRRIIIDAKKQRRKIDIVQVEAFKGLMDDVGATHGFLICPHGHTKAAERRAQKAITICLVPIERLQDFDPASWPKCENNCCKQGRVFWDGFPEASIILQPINNPNPSARQSARFIHYVGKCDCCGRFHVKCLTCEELFSLADEDEHQCNCKLPWFWLTSIEQDEKGERSAELHFIRGKDKFMTVDRRPV